MMDNMTYLVQQKLSIAVVLSGDSSPQPLAPILDDSQKDTKRILKGL